VRRGQCTSSSTTGTAPTGKSAGAAARFFPWMNNRVTPLGAAPVRKVRQLETARHFLRSSALTPSAQVLL
jgi:hypothetical protein